MGLAATTANFGLGWLDWWSAERERRRQEERRAEALGALDEFDPDLSTWGDLAPQFQESEDVLGRAGSELTQGMANARSLSLRDYNNELLGGLHGVGDTYDSSLGNIRTTADQGVGELGRSRIGLGSTLDMLELPDPEKRYQESLLFGNESAAANEKAGLSSAVNDEFANQSRLGVDPFESGAFSSTRRDLTDRRFNDLFASRTAASGERGRLEEANAGLRGEQLGREMTSNTALDQAIAALRGQEMGAVGGLGEGRLSGEVSLRNNLANTYAARQTGIEGNYLPEIGKIRGAQAELPFTEINTLETLNQGEYDRKFRALLAYLQTQGIPLDTIIPQLSGITREQDAPDSGGGLFGM